jgi:hypothetical protein
LTKGSSMLCFSVHSPSLFRVLLYLICRVFGIAHWMVYQSSALHITIHGNRHTCALPVTQFEAQISTTKLLKAVRA